MRDPSPAGSPAPEPVRVTGSPGVARARIVLLLVVLGAWLMPWDVALPDVAGALETGVPAAFALVVAIGLAATLFLARSRVGLALGEAATSACAAGLIAALLATKHPWLPGGDRRSAWFPIFLPLALLALLDLVVRWRRGPVGREITGIRAASAIVAGAALTVALQPIPAAAALWLGLSPAASLVATSAGAARRVLLLSSLLASAALALAPEILDAIEPVPPSIGDATIWALAFRVGSVALALLSIVELAASRRADAAPSPAL